MGVGKCTGKSEIYLRVGFHPFIPVGKDYVGVNDVGVCEASALQQVRKEKVGANEEGSATT